MFSYGSVNVAAESGKITVESGYAFYSMFTNITVTCGPDFVLDVAEGGNASGSLYGSVTIR